MVDSKLLFKSGIKILVYPLFIYATVLDVSALDYNKIVDKVKVVVCDTIFPQISTVAAAVASLICVIAGLKWVASENDPGARKQAKDMFIHALVGLLIIIVIMGVLSTGFKDLGDTC